MMRLFVQSDAGFTRVRVQATLQCSVEFSGVGLHSGDACRIIVRPAREDTGIVFRRCDLAAENSGDRQAVLIAAAPENVARANHGTTLANAHGVSVATVEHLMAAFALFSIDNALVETYGPEIPILDGSSALFANEFRKAGVKMQTSPRRETIVDEAVRIEQDGRFVQIEPADGFSLDISIAFEDCMIGRQSVCLHIGEAFDPDRLAKARTFCQLREVEPLRRLGLIRGGSLENSIVVDGARVLNDEPLRDPYEFALHKALDLIGDLYLLGGPIRGAVRAEKPGHDLNVRAARALAKRRRAAETPARPAAVTA